MAETLETELIDFKEETETEADAPATKQESLEEMLSRHRKEKAKLQEKEISLKKSAAKGSKAEQKAKKKQVEEEISRLMSQLESRQSEELASLGYKSSNNNSDSKSTNLDSLVKAIAGVSCSTPSIKSGKPSKSAMRRGKRAQEELEREKRIQEEQNNLISDRMIENENLERKLDPLGLTINEIKPDGHCLYRAIEDQLSLHCKGKSLYNYQELREMTAKYMRENASDFLPFFLSEGKVDLDSRANPIEIFEKYCEEVQSTAIWGGQLELGALTHCLKKHIVVYSGYFPEVEMGKEYKPGEEYNGNNPSIILSYHRHAYGLGEHYNSVVPHGMVR